MKEFLELDEYMRLHPFGEFKVKPIYSEEGDFLMLYWEDKDHFCRMLTPELGIYLSFEQEEIIGVKICNLKWHIKQQVEKHKEQDKSPREYITLDMFGDYLKSTKERMKCESFRIALYYSPEDDSILFYWEDTPSYSDYVNDEVTIMRRCSDATPMGIEIAGMKEFCGELYP